VRHGADLDLVDLQNNTALFMACEFGRRFCVASLLANGAKANWGSEWYSPLWKASKEGHHLCVQEFSRVSDVNLFPTAANPLIVAIAEQKVSCVDDLLRLQPPQTHVFNALLAAIWFANWDCVRCILDAGAKRGLNLLQVKDEDGLSAEQFAAARGCDELELALLRSGSATVAHANVPRTSIQEQSYWKHTGPPDSVCVTRCNTLRFYRYSTAVAVYGCRGRDCAYFEVTLRYSGPNPQFGLCSGDSAAGCRGQFDGAALKRTLSIDSKGVGDTDHSWAVDGIRGKKWHNDNDDKPKEWGVKWRQGDVIGIACNMRTRQMIVSLNGDYSAPNGVVFNLPCNARVMYPALFSSVEGHVRVNLGHEPFQHAFPSQEYVAFAALPPCEDEE
jgi:ankyrin repeat protein